jgi:predicted nucleic-acid-binding protein
VKAVDANVLLRLVTGDDPAQATRAAELVAADGMVLSLSVLMESEWVLRSYYRWDRAEVATAMTALRDLDGVHIADDDHFAWIVDRYRAGADFADMVHIVAGRTADMFATFDRGVARHATNAPVPIETLVA